MKIARLKVSELTRRNKWLGFDIFLLTYITTILFIYPLMYTWSTLFLTIILITTEVILCALLYTNLGITALAADLVAAKSPCPPVQAT